jgi:glucokinase
VVPTAPVRGGEAVLADALALAQTLQAEAMALGGTVAGVGVGVPELVDAAGEVTTDAVIAWCGLQVRERFARLGPAVVEADVRAAALAEARYGAGRSFATFVYVTVGTGISSCLVVDGTPYAGMRGGALVLASAPLDWVCPSCGAQTGFVLEEFAAGPGLAARYGREIGRPVARAEEVLEAAASGEPAAVEVVRSAGEVLGNALAFVVNLLDPAAIVVGGGLGLAGGLYWESLVRSARTHIWNEAARTLPILPAGLGADAGWIGAAVAAAERAGETAPEP